MSKMSQSGSQMAVFCQFVLVTKQSKLCFSEVIRAVFIRKCQKLMFLDVLLTPLVTPLLTTLLKSQKDSRKRAEFNKTVRNVRKMSKCQKYL